MHLQTKEHEELLALPGARREAWKRFSVTAFRRNQPCHHCDFSLLASITMRG